MGSLSLVYALQSISVATAAATPYQIMVIDRYNDAGAAWSKAQVAQMGGGQADPRQLFGYLSLGEAEDYRPYWQSSWATSPPAWLGPENPQWEGNYAVKFWDMTWQTQVKGYLDGIMAQGFDGVFFDVVDVYQRGWVQQQGRANPAQDMIDLVKGMSDYAKSRKPGFQVYVNNAEELLANKAYLNAIDGVLKEDLYYSGNRKNAASDIAWSTRYLDMAKAAGKNVSVIDYVSDPAKIADMRSQATADGYGYYTSNLELKGINQTGFSTFSQTSVVPDVFPLKGTSRKDTLLGGDGNDHLFGYLGNDILTGGTGRDTFSFTTKLNPKTNVDRITDFTVDEDAIGLSGRIFKNVAQKAGTPLKKAFFTIGVKAKDANDYVVYNKKTGGLFYDADGSGQGAAVKFAQLSKNLKLAADDFFVL